MRPGLPETDACHQGLLKLLQTLLLLLLFDSLLSQVARDLRLQIVIRSQSRSRGNRLLILFTFHGDFRLHPLDLGHTDLRKWQTFLALIHGGQDFRIHLCELAHLVGQSASLVECLQGTGRVQVIHFHGGLNVHTRILVQKLVGQAGGPLCLHVLYV